MCVEQAVDLVTGETEALGETPAPVPLCLLQISHHLTWDRTRAATAETRRATA